MTQKNIRNRLTQDGTLEGVEGRKHNHDNEQQQPTNDKKMTPPVLARLMFRFPLISKSKRFSCEEVGVFKLFSVNGIMGTHDDGRRRRCCVV